MKNNFLLAIGLLLTTSFTSSAQEMAGPWKGAISTQGMEIDLIFNLSEKDGQWSSTLDVPMQGATDIPMDETSLSNNELTIKSNKLQMSYTGKLADGAFSGTYTQGGQNFPLILKKTEKTMPGKTSLPSSSEELAKLAGKETGNFKYSVEDFFKSPEASYFKLSPNGKYISYLKRNSEGKKTLIVKEVATDKETAVVKDGEDIIKAYLWGTDNRILYMKDSGGDENFHFFGINLDGSNDIELTPFPGVKADLLETLDEDKDHIIISLNKDDKQQEEPYLLNINTGDLKKLFTVEEDGNPVSGYLFDKDGELRGISYVVNGVQSQFFYKIDGKMVDFRTFELDDTFSPLSFDYSTSNPHDAYVATNLNSDKTEIILYDFKARKELKKIYSNDTYDVSSMRLSEKRKYEMDYVLYNGEKTIVVPFSETYKKIDARLKKEFGNKDAYVVGRSKDESIQLIVVTSDKIVAEYYTYDVKTDKIKLLYKLLPHLKEADMAEMRPITFKSRDGKTIHGYITLPKAALEGQKVPMIVMPHGGPQGVRDSWGFNPENQLFASRGYATLNVNFRISGGYGKEFMTAGFKQIGRAAMDDVEDGIAYVLEQGWIDKDKIAIYGASHGGYAVLRGMTKTPDLYACGVDYVGVSNLNTFMGTIPAYWEKYRDFLYETWYNPNIPEEKAIMDEISPALHTDKIKKPLFVVQGANDPRVNIDEADQIVEKLRARGITVPYMVKYDEGHGFYKEENRLDLYRTMMGFFAENLK
ncbi:MAG: prolyl oligopeptidase family serine peptidase [Bacteroidota bacterium]